MRFLDNSLKIVAHNTLLQGWANRVKECRSSGLSVNGAEGSSIIFSLIETAKENKLDPYRYLTHVLGLAPNLDQSKPDWAEQLLPENAPEYCKANYRKKYFLDLDRREAVFFYFRMT